MAALGALLVANFEVGPSVAPKTILTFPSKKKITRLYGHVMYSPMLLIL
jgi:hypothetical protein